MATPTPTPTPTITPTPTSTPTCFSGITDGNYSYTDCCGLERSGASLNDIICVDTSYPYSGISISSVTCDVDCNEGPVTYEFSVTGVCENTGNGAISIDLFGGTIPYTIDNTNPGTLSSQTGLGPFLYSGLTGGTYVFRVNDSSNGVNQAFFINVLVGGCFCAYINNATGTTCGFNNGSFTVDITSTSSPYTYQLYKNGSPLGSAISTSLDNYTYSNLSSGIYSVFVTDDGGATAFTESAVIKESSSLDFGYYVVSESPCNPGQGSATITGETGESPYTYSWSNGQTGSTATGLTQGIVSVTVTDSNNCVKTRDIIIPFASPLGVVSTTPTNANCFNCDGSILVTISGGTPPYTYLGDTGQQLTTNQTSFALTGLCAGGHTILINDVAGCNTNTNAVINSTAGFDVVSVNSTNSLCTNEGSISIGIIAPQGLFTYTVDNGITTQSTTTPNQSITFNNLSSGTYDVTITANGNQCIYTTQVVIQNEDKFNVVVATTGATCGLSNGIADILTSQSVSTIDFPLDYSLRDVSANQIVYQNNNTNSLNEIIPNLPIGTYEITVTDNTGCQVRKRFSIEGTSGIVAGISKTDCIFGDDGTATITIFDGNPPFTSVWSDGQSGLTATNLTGGTYTVTVTDSDGCVYNGSVTINCESGNVECYEINTICEKDFTTTVGRKRDFLSMVNEAYLDISSGFTNCELIQSVFCVQYGLTGATGWVSGDTLCYYTGTTLYDIPTDQDWIDAIEQLLNTVSEISTYTINSNTNQLIIESDCSGEEDPLKGAKFELISRVELDLRCDPDVTPTPTPSITPTNTPTPTVTSTSTPTPTPTPSTPVATANLTINTTALTCAKGSISVVKNGLTTIYSINKLSGSGNINTTNTITVNVGDSIEIFATASTPTGASCQTVVFYTDLSVDVGGSNVIFITSIDNDYYTFTMGPSGETIDIDFLVS